MKYNEQIIIEDILNILAFLPKFDKKKGIIKSKKNHTKTP
tara:strand:+ start:1293 stop:1412 length:120 start_codon:yes stop_codon:yes gene_type:complete